MAFHEDLQPFDSSGLPLLAVGWLEGDRDFATGSVPADVFARLSELAEDPVTPGNLPRTPGLHACSLCQFDGPAGGGELYVPGDGLLYVMPLLAVHYVAAHRYRPPDEFLAAVLACPDTRSMEYKRAFLAAGGRDLLRASDPDGASA